jgi:hypothetical protein
LPNDPAYPLSDEQAQPSRWLELIFPVQELVANFPTEADAVFRYSPRSGPYSASNYPAMFKGLTTKFDDTIVLEEDGVLKEKILLEYKTAKSSKQRNLDGNAHERLTFQIMQYLEVATRYTKCSLIVLANSAFIKYKNKYHVNFHIQADRLSNFSWFIMRHICTEGQYMQLVEGLMEWLFKGIHRDVGGLP